MIIIMIIEDFAVPTEHSVKLKESEKKDKYLDLRELKKNCGLIKGLEDLEIKWRVETTQSTALLRSARILRRVLETWGDLLSLRL